MWTSRHQQDHVGLAVEVQLRLLVVDANDLDLAVKRGQRAEHLVEAHAPRSRAPDTRCGQGEAEAPALRPRRMSIEDGVVEDARQRGHLLQLRRYRLERGARAERAPRGFSGSQRYDSPRGPAQRSGSCVTSGGESFWSTIQTYPPPTTDEEGPMPMG
jgi:hypothetical protein